MIIGGFKVPDALIKSEAGKRYLLFKCKDCVYSASIADDIHCRFHVINELQQAEVDSIVLSEVYERAYSESQTALLKEIASLYSKFAVEAVWSYSRLGLTPIKKETDLAPRYRTIVRVAHDLLSYDPILAYLTCLQEIAKEKKIFESLSIEAKKDLEVYIETLTYIKNELEKTKLIQNAKKFLLELKEVPETKEFYNILFKVEIKPAFIGSKLLFEEMPELELLDEYQVGSTTIQIFKHPDKTENLYFINPPEYTLTPEKYFVLSKTKEVVAGYQPGTSLSLAEKTRKYFESIYESTIADIARRSSIKLLPEEASELSSIVARYTVGYGILEILLNDRKITDIYVDAPIGLNPLYIVHSDFGQCKTNILYTESEAQALVTKIRAMSARPFDEAHPVLDFDLPDLDTRVAVIGPPLSPDGTAFAFRLHKITPWTLPQFIDVKYLNPLAAGLISFFIDNQATTLITGSRGSGKTSLVGSCILEITKNTRILVQEDTMEIPVPYMKKIGFNIQRLKTRPAIGAETGTTEVAPEAALRTALRLGDSALIIGEVRSREAKVLYEAMRVGAAGNIVMGTIHGDSAYSVWDRVVNDLEVPTTSFKATDLVVVARPIRFSGSLKRHRRVVQITEVKKHWNRDPAEEGGLLDLMLYDARKDELELLEDNLKESDLFSKISKVSGLTLNEIWKDIAMRGNAKAYLVELKNQFNIPQLLEAENSSIANDKLLLLKEKSIQETGAVDFENVLAEWKDWVKNSFIKKFLKTKK